MASCIERLLHDRISTFQVILTYIIIRYNNIEIDTGFVGRNHRQLPNIFVDNQVCKEEGLVVLVHAELYVSHLKELSDEQPSWFLEDLSFLHHLIEYQEPFTQQGDLFQARVSFLHCNWHYHHGRMEPSVYHLDRVYIFLCTRGFRSISLCFVFCCCFRFTNRLENSSVSTLLMMSPTISMREPRTSCISLNWWTLNSNIRS